MQLLPLVGISKPSGHKIKPNEHRSKGIDMYIGTQLGI